MYLCRLAFSGQGPWNKTGKEIRFRRYLRQYVCLNVDWLEEQNNNVSLIVPSLRRIYRNVEKGKHCRDYFKTAFMMTIAAFDEL